MAATESLPASAREGGEGGEGGEEDDCVFSCHHYESRTTGLINRIVVRVTENRRYEIDIGARMYVTIDVRINATNTTSTDVSGENVGELEPMAHHRRDNSVGPRVTTTSITESGNHTGSQEIVVSGNYSRPATVPQQAVQPDEGDN